MQLYCDRFAVERGKPPRHKNTLALTARHYVTPLRRSNGRIHPAATGTVC
ncbi:UNVERIFIED_ORG: hypothetical protein J2Y84_003623 [Pseudomonas reinekei]